MNIGEKVNKLTLLENLAGKKSRFLCDCGREHITCRYNVSRQMTKSCGCLRGEPESGKSVRNMPEYQAWSDMKQRCYNPKVWAYPYYGGRGIFVSEEWRKSFLTFIKDMGPRIVGTSLDRIDNDLGYSKDNCKWSTKKEQMNNRRKYNVKSMR